jgi:hypothetical protein
MYVRVMRNLPTRLLREGWRSHKCGNGHGSDDYFHESLLFERRCANDWLAFSFGYEILQPTRASKRRERHFETRP